MKVIVLTCSTGQGHNSAAKAIYDEFYNRGIEVKTFNALLFMSKISSKMVTNSLNTIAVKLPKAFGWMYHAGTKISSQKRKSVIYFANSLYAKKLGEYIKKNKFDIAVCSHLFPIEALSYLKNKENLNIKCYAILTDYTRIPFIEETNMDKYIIPQIELLNEFSERINKDKLVPLGIPIGKDIINKMSKEKARDELKINKTAICYLIMTGGEGCGNIIPIINTIEKEEKRDYFIFVLTGRNERLYKKIIKKFKNNSKIITVSFTDKVSIYMDACDIILSKPGGLSSTEIAAKGIPLIYIQPIPGCENKNAEFFNKKGMSIIANNPIEAGFEAIKLTLNSIKMNEMIENQNKYINKYSTKDICNYIIGDNKK